MGRYFSTSLHSWQRTLYRTLNVEQSAQCGIFHIMAYFINFYKLCTCLHIWYINIVGVLHSNNRTKSDNFWHQCDLFAGNASNNMRVLDFYARFIGYTPGGIYNQLLQSQSYCKHTALIFTGWPLIFFWAPNLNSLSCLRASAATDIRRYCIHFTSSFILARTKLADFSAVATAVTLLLLCCHYCLELASYSWYNHRTDHTENIFAAIVDTCVLSHCIATVATLPLLLHWVVA
jgi:hypothetical protein